MGHFFSVGSAKLPNNLNLVQEANRGSRSEYFIVAVLAVLMIFGCLAYGWQHYQHLDLGYRAVEAGKERVQLEESRETLRSQLQIYRSSERILGIAHKMGMTGPEPGQVRPAPTVDDAARVPELAARQ
jgi:hypothetical protein